MTKKLKIIMAQQNFTVGDINGNVQKQIEAANIARDQFQADIIIFPELSITGYPPEDLLLRQSFIHDTQFALQKMLTEIKGIHALVGYPQHSPAGLLNACSLIYNGNTLGRYAKQHLPNYGVFDEDRYFTPQVNTCVIPINNIPIGIVICEDLWFPHAVSQAAAQGARIIVSPNASPFEVNKHEERLAVLRKRALSEHVSLVYVNAVGGQDELVFDGGSMVVDEAGNIVQFAGFFKETLHPVEIDITSTKTQISSSPVNVPETLPRIYDALVLSLRDYVQKNHFKDVLIGVSGGIDSALTLAIAVDALGKDHVEAIMMPSRYTSDLSLEEALALIQHFGVASHTLSIEALALTFNETLKPIFNNLKPDVTEENIQARIRAILLMALSNKLNKLVLTTGNRSEYAVGYCTLYGDMAGGFAVLKDVPKTLVYALARYRNTLSYMIPERTITRAPTAELRPDQKDEDSLPPYDVLDRILDGYLNEGLSIDELIAKGFDAETIQKIIRLVRMSEYKRKQSAPGPHIHHKSFGKDWRYPITNGYKG